MNQNFQEEANRFGDAVALYLQPCRHELRNYAWPMSDKARNEAQQLGFTIDSTDGGAETTHQLRRQVAAGVRALHTSSDARRDESLEKLCSFVIRVWGGLGSNKDETIRNYSETYLNRSLPDLSTIVSLEHLRMHGGCDFPFAGISSWSKWLNFVWSEWALIYDARIAFALNTIHFLQGVDARVFPVPPGRDKLLSNLDSQSLAALPYLRRHGKQIPPSGADTKRMANWLKSATMQENQTYEYYLLVMQRVRDVMQQKEPCSLIETEMLLFFQSNRKVVHDLLTSLSSLVAKPAIAVAGIDAARGSANAP